MVVNDYDNTILYMDYLLSELIKSLREGTAVVFFFSDHGQSLGENGQYGHGYLVAERYKDSPEQRNAAAFAWMSPSARKAFPEAFAHMAANGGKFMGHDVIFHSLLGCVGVKTDLAVQGRNFCGPEFVEDSWLKERYGGGR
jgi:glucan phosphoethanolaminetransferase (alkaline phosphatase superfamily)